MRFLLIVLAVIAAATIGAQQRFARQVREIKAGVLVIDSAFFVNASNMYVADNPTPHVWYNLDSNNRVKPTSWEFVNPRASSGLTAEMVSRWNDLHLERNPVLPALSIANATLSKATAPYWEVFLRTATDEQLADYDVLLLSVRGYLSLQPLEREKLRAFVDQGGLLWVDVAGTTLINAANGPPLSFDKSIGAPGSMNIDLFHPLMSRPNQLNSTDVGWMQTDSSPGLYAVDPGNYTAAAITPLLASLPGEFELLEEVASDPSGVLVGLGRQGDGHILLTARGAATAMNRTRLGSGGYVANDGFNAFRPAMDRTADAVASLLVNALHLGSSYGEPYRSSRKMNASPVDLGAPLLRIFQAELPLAPGNRNFIPPATFKGLFIVSADNRIYVYDGQPGTDRDGDGNPDDGVVDSALDKGMDLLWVSQALDGPISSPATFEVKNPAGAATANQIVVVDVNGTAHAFDAFATGAPDLQNVAEIYNVAPNGGPATFDLSVDGRGPYAPTLFEGLAYVSDAQAGGLGKLGRVWVFNPATGLQVTTGIVPWSVGGALSTGIPEISGPPTIGYIPVQDNSGGEDLVAYVPTRPNATNLGGVDATAGLTSLWLGVRGERPTLVQVIGSELQVTTRASLQGLRVYESGLGGPDPLGIRVSVIDVNGDPLPMARFDGLGNEIGPSLKRTFSGNVTQSPDGILRLELGVDGWDPGYSLRIDYRIDWGTGLITATNQITRGQLFFPDASRTRRVLGALALGAQGNLFASVSDQVRGGSVFALREEGRGAFKLLYRYELYDQHVMNLNQTTPFTQPGVLPDEDPVTTLVPFVAGTMSNFALQGSPTVRGTNVYVTATAQKGAFNIPMSILIALDANPESLSIPVGPVQESFTILQPDIARSVNSGQPETYSVLSPNQYVYELIGETGTVRVNSLMSSQRGIVQQSLSTSQPVILRRAGQPDLVIEPDASGGRWSPLRWFSILHGTATGSPAIATGDTVFVAGNSHLPDLLSGVPLGSTVERGVMFAIDGNLNPTSTDAFSVTGRPWIRQVPVVKLQGPDVVGNPVVLWPQTTNINSFEEWQTRYMSTALNSGDTAFGIASGDGALFAWGPTHLYGFTRGDLMVADEGRALRLDASGNVLWSTDASRASGPNTGSLTSSTMRPLVRPTRVYRLTDEELIVVDPGSNRIARMDSQGREVRSIDRFRVDPNYRPDGYQSGSPNTLNSPSDVTTFTTYIDGGSNLLSSPNALEYWIHYVVADTGNRRIIELVDRYVADPVTRAVGGPVQVGGDAQVGVLTWHSPSSVSGKGFEYVSVTRAFNPVTGQQVYAAGIGGTQPARVDMGIEPATPTSPVRESSSGSGGIVLFDGNTAEVIENFIVPDIDADVFWSESGNAFSSPATAARTRPIRALNSVTMRYVSEGVDHRLALMFTDSTGVYEIFQPTIGPTEDWQVRWMLPREVFRFMRQPGGVLASNPQDFRPTYARRLDSGEVILTNSYLGRTRGGAQYTGEVLAVNGEIDDAEPNAFGFGRPNMGFSHLSIRLQVSDLGDTRRLYVPVFADLR